MCMLCVHCIGNIITGSTYVSSIIVYIVKIGIYIINNLY